MSLSYIKRAEQGNRSALSFVGSIIMCFGTMFAAGIPLFFGIFLKKAMGKKVVIGNAQQLMSNFSEPVGYSLLMTGFLMVLLSVWFSVKYIHRRKFGTIWSEEDRFRPKDFLKGLLFSICLFGVSDLLMHYYDPSYHTWVFNSKRFWTFVPFVLFFVPIQTLAEEALFRGHLYQASGLAVNWINKTLHTRLSSKWIAVIFCSLLFGLFHFGNAEMGISFWKMGLVYIGTGLMIGLTVVFSKGIEFAWAFHLINNLYLSTIVTFKGSSLDGPTLFTIPAPHADRVLTEFAIQFGIFLIALMILYRKNIKGLLNEQV
jgi:membrane protease YdiL (CAAX protease family)